MGSSVYMNYDRPSVFISYAYPDQARVLPLCDFLEERNFEVWIDCRKLKPGQDWDFEIRRALDKSTFVIAFLSENSYDRRGYVQRELKIALDKLAEKLVDDIYLIPILLDNTFPIPDQVKGIQSIRATSPDYMERVLDALNHQLQRLRFERSEAQRKGSIAWEERILRESWDGIPGYEVELRWLQFDSERYPEVSQISDYIKGQLLPELFEHRAQKVQQLPALFNYAQGKFFRTNTFDAYCSEPTVVGSIVSILCSIHWYGAGAAHPNHSYKSYDFLLEPLILVSSLSEIFEDADEAFPIVQKRVRDQLYAVHASDKAQDEGAPLDREWVDRGTSAWEDFNAFTFTEESVEIHFAPYAVASYSDGPQSVRVSFENLVRLLRREFVSALKLEHLGR